MIVYKDKATGDEMFSDAYRMEELENFYKVWGKLTTEKTNLDDKAFGANPSAEEQQEDMDENAVHGVDIVIANRLSETSFTKKTYKTYISGYMKNILPKIDKDKQASFQENAKKAVQYVLSKFNDWQFFQGASMDPDGMIALMEYVEVDGQSIPYMLFFKDGMIEEKN